jgi:hypothetical protein
LEPERKITGMPRRPRLRAVASAPQSPPKIIAPDMLFVIPLKWLGIAAGLTVSALAKSFKCDAYPCDG